MASALLARRFVQPWDLHVRQPNDGRYIYVGEHLNVEHLFSHLRGDIMLGTYVLDNGSRARFITFDADDDEQFSNLMGLAQALDVEGVPAYLETSRRGGHLWLFFS